MRSANPASEQPDPRGANHRATVIGICARRSGIPLRADSRALRLCVVPLPSTDGRWGSD
jgi:hypothetical protein